MPDGQNCEEMRFDVRTRCDSGSAADHSSVNMPAPIKLSTRNDSADLSTLFSTGKARSDSGWN